MPKRGQMRSLASAMNAEANSRNDRMAIFAQLFDKDGPGLGKGQRHTVRPLASPSRHLTGRVVLRLCRFSTRRRVASSTPVLPQSAFVR